MTGRGGIRGQSGFALILVLWVLMIIGLLAAGYAHHTKTRVTDVRSHQTVVDLQWRSYAGLALAIAEIERVKATGAASPDQYACSFGDADVVAIIEDEQGKIDLNEVSPETVSALLVEMGTDKDDARQLALRLADYLDPDDFSRSSGNEATDFLQRGLAPPRNGRLISLRDLAGIPGWRQISMQEISQHATVHSGRRQVDPASASDTVRTVLTNLGAAPENTKASAKARFTVRMAASREQDAQVSSVVVFETRPDLPTGYRVLEWQDETGPTVTPIINSCERMN